MCAPYMFVSAMITCVCDGVGSLNGSSGKVVRVHLGRSPKAMCGVGSKIIT